MMQTPYVGSIGKRRNRKKERLIKEQVVGLETHSLGSSSKLNEHHNEKKKSGHILSGRANGAMTISKYSSRSIQKAAMARAIDRAGKFEVVWYPVFLIAGLLCLILIPLLTEMVLADILLLCFSVLSLWLSMAANNLVAKGFRIGLLLSVIGMALYVVVCLFQKVWGEILINVLMYIPLEIVGYINWAKSSSDGGKLDEIKVMSAKTRILYILLLLGITFGGFAVLKLPFINQQFAIFNALSIAGCVVGDLARNKRYLEVWPFFMVCNIGGIILWLCQIFAGGSGVTLAILPTALSFCATLSNNFNGLNIWYTLYKNANKNGGVILAKRQVDIKKIIKLKRVYKNMVCKETD